MAPLFRIAKPLRTASPVETPPRARIRKNHVHDDHSGGEIVAGAHIGQARREVASSPADRSSWAKT
jgi:hypothetical protein